jgi:hypothetical protein
MRRLWRFLWGGMILFCVAAGCSSEKGPPRPDVKALSVRAAGMIRDAARELGREQFEGGTKPPAAASDAFIDVLRRTGTLFGGPVMGEQDTYGEKVTPIVVAGLELTAAELLKVLPGGVQFPDARVQKEVENLDSRAEEKRLRKQGNLGTSFEDTVRVLAYLALFSDESLVRQIVPTGSEWSTALSRMGFVGQDGQIRVPAPPVFEAVPNTRWNAFLDALDGLPTIFEIQDRDVKQRRRPLL